MKFDDVKRLQQKKYRETFGYFLAEGEHLVLELHKAALTNPLLGNCELYVTRDYEHWPSPFNRHLVSARHFAQIAETKTPQGIVALVPILPAVQPQAGERAVYLHEAQDPGNLGTILRTLAWFGRFRCLLSPRSVDPYNSKAIRASMGAIFHVPLETDVRIESLNSRYPRVASLGTTGRRVQQPSFREFDCYLFGNESRGLPDDLAAACTAAPFTIEGCGRIESLNLAAAVNICAYEINRS